MVSVVFLVIQVGQCEVLRDQVVEFSRRALAAGVDVTLQEWVDMVRRPPNNEHQGVGVGFTAQDARS
jgi:acetyl esterase/lipase